MALIGTYRPGVVFGELSFCTGHRREQTVAMEGNEIVEIHFADLISELGRSPQAMVDMSGTNVS